MPQSVTALSPATGSLPPAPLAVPVAHPEQDRHPRHTDFTVQDRLTLCRRLAKPGTDALLIDADNKARTWLPLTTSTLAIGGPLAIEPGDHVLALDSDDPTKFAQVQALDEALERDGCAPVLLSSGKGLHLWAEIRDPNLMAYYLAKAKRIGLDIRRGTRDVIRFPMAPHRLGERVRQVLKPTHSALRLRLALWDGPPPMVRRALARHDLNRHIRGTIRAPHASNRLGIYATILPGDFDATARRLGRLASWCTPRPLDADVPAPPKRRRRSLSRHCERLLRDGVPLGQRHQAIMSVTLAAINAGWTEDELFLVLINSKLGEKIREQAVSEYAQRRYVSLGWKKAIQRATDQPPVPGGPTVQAEVARFRKAAAVYPWKARSGTTDREVLEEHFDIVARSGQLEHDASARRVADARGMTWQAVSKSNGRLKKIGWLVWREKRWVIQVPPQGIPISLTHATTAVGGHETCVNRIGKSDHDVWRRQPGGLGKDTLRVWSHLDAMTPVTAKALATALRRKLNVIYYHLKKLRECHRPLAVKRGTGYLRAGAATLDQVAEELGVAGLGAAQRERHKRQREDRERRRREMIAESRTTAPAVPVKGATMPGQVSEQVPLEAQLEVAESVLAVVQAVFECEVVTVLNSTVSASTGRGGVATAEAVTLPGSSGWPQALPGLGPRPHRVHWTRERGKRRVTRSGRLRRTRAGLASRT